MNRALALVVASAVAVAACGGDSDADPAGVPAGEPRTIEVVMTDMAYAPDAVDVEPGETIRFVFRNEGSVRHEAAVGDLAAQEEHHAEMAEMADMGETHGDMDMGSMPHDGMDELHAVVVEPGESAELVHTFDASGSMLIGCHEPGHWEAGMRMTIDV